METEKAAYPLQGGQRSETKSCWGDIFLGFFMVLPGASTTFVGHNFAKKTSKHHVLPVLDTLEKVAAAGWKRNIISMLFFYSKQSNNKRIKSGRDWNGVLGSFALGRSLRPDNTLWNYNFMGQKHNPTMKYSLCVAWWYREVSWKSHRFAVVPEKGALFAQKTQVVWCCPPVSTCLRWWLLESAHKIHWKYTDSFIVQPNCSRHLSLSMGIWVHLPKKGNGVTNPTTLDDFLVPINAYLLSGFSFSQLLKGKEYPSIWLNWALF